MQDTDKVQPSTEWSDATKRMVAVAGVLLAIFILVISRSVLPFILVAAILAFLLDPVVIFFNSRLRMPYWLAVILTYFLLLIALLLLPLIATPAVINAVSSIEIDIVDLVRRTANWLQQTLESILFVEILEFKLYLSPVVDPALETLTGVVP